MRKPYFSKPRKCWFVREGNSQINLGKDKAEAFKRYHTLMVGQTTVQPGETAVQIQAVRIKIRSLHCSCDVWLVYRRGGRVKDGVASSSVGMWCRHGWFGFDVVV